MDKLDEFIGGLQTILDSPNPPREDLVRVIQSTQRDFLTSALSISTVSWPTRTHLELVKIVISLPIQEPPPDIVMANPTVSHETDPFFNAEYFDKLRLQLLSLSVQQLGESDGSWVRNIGFSIEATIMQVSRRADALEKLEELTKKDNDGSSNGHDFARIRTYCAQVLGSGTLAMHHWVAMARMAYAVFHVLPFSTRSMVGPAANSSNAALQPVVAQLVAHYSSWLQIIMQMVENHGPALSRRMPAVVEDPATRQFKWGIPTLLFVTTTELLRNFVMRRILLPCVRQPDDGCAGGWAADAAAVNGEEQRLEQFEQAILGKIIAQDASAVYGMMSEHHRLLQILEAQGTGSQRVSGILGKQQQQQQQQQQGAVSDMLALSLTHACYGLAPVLGFEEQALMQAMDMQKLRECLQDMKATALSIYAPLRGCYPRAAAAVPAYAELLLLRSATAVFNIDRPWDGSAEALAPAVVPGITPELAAHLTRVLRVASAYFDVFSLDTAEGSSVMGRLAQCAFMHALGQAGAEAPVAAVAAWACEFVALARAFMAPQLLCSQVAAALGRAAAVVAGCGRVGEMARALAGLGFGQWAALAQAGFQQGLGAGQAGLQQGLCAAQAECDSVLGAVWACARRADAAALDAVGWQVAVAMSHPAGGFLAYAVAVLCAPAARQAVIAGGAPADGNPLPRVKLNTQGVAALRALERVLMPGADALEAWRAAGVEPLFVPLMYAADAGRAREAAEFAQAQLPAALELLHAGDVAAWARQLGLPPDALGVSAAEMRMVARFVAHYAEHAAEFVPLLARLLGPIPPQLPPPKPLNPPNPSAPKPPSPPNLLPPKSPNPYRAPNIMNRVPPIESQSSPHACDVAGALRT
ncbi:hypothetical protein LPJ66_005715, partial [Kickxella alabastrina]